MAEAGSGGGWPLHDSRVRAASSQPGPALADRTGQGPYLPGPQAACQRRPAAVAQTSSQLSQERSVPGVLIPGARRQPSPHLETPTELFFLSPQRERPGGLGIQNTASRVISGRPRSLLESCRHQSRGREPSERIDGRLGVCPWRREFTPEHGPQARKKERFLQHCHQEEPLEALGPGRWGCGADTVPGPHGSRSAGQQWAGRVAPVPPP